VSGNVSQQVPNGNSSAGPAWTTFGGKTLMAWKGVAADPRIWWATSSSLEPDAGSNQYTWTPIQPVPNALSSSSPALATLKGVVYLVWKGPGTDGSMYWSKFDGNGAWTAPQSVSGAGGTSTGPALAASGGTLYLAWKDESDGTNIYWSTSGDGGRTWSSQQPISGVGTSAGPALASDGAGGVYLAWKGIDPDTTVWWSKCTDGKTWSAQQRGPVGALVGPGLAVDGSKVLWVALTAVEFSPSAMYPVFTTGGPVVYFSSLTNESQNQWSPRADRYDAYTPNRPALISTGRDGSGVMLAWSGPQVGAAAVSYSRLLLPPQSIEFTMNNFVINMMRSGHLGIKNGSDTDYVGMAIKVTGQPVVIATKGVGDQTGGQVGVGLGLGPITVHPGDLVYFHYAIINSGQGAPSATGYLEKVGNALLNAVEKADEAAIQSYTGLPLSQLSPQEAGALIGAQIGTTLPGVGTILGAIAGWLADDVWNFAFPDCDGPVAAGLFILDAWIIRSLATYGIYSRTDNNPGVNSPSGCGANSDYQVDWSFGFSL